MTFEGRHYRLDGPVLLPTPLQQPRPPIWCATGWPRRRPLARAVAWDGVYLTEHVEEHRPLGAADVAAAVGAIGELRSAVGPFDVAVNFYLDEPAVVAGLAGAGATWCLGLTPASVDEHRALIRRGPPPAG